MKLVMLALFDVKVSGFMTPFFAQSTGAAVRSLSDLVNGRDRTQPDAPPVMHPEDFRLFVFGEWDDVGRLVLADTPQLVAECVNLKESPSLKVV
jgi:hypothetical protein